MLRKLVCLFLLFSTLPSFAYSYYPKQNFQSRFYQKSPSNIVSTLGRKARYNRFYNQQPLQYYNSSYLSGSDLNTLEKYAMNKTFKRENDLQRLERLENLAFGAIQDGDIYSRFKNVENAILSRPIYGTKQGLLSTLSNYFLGQPTGYTPHLITSPNYTNFDSANFIPYNNISPRGFSNNNFEQYSNGMFGGGWRMSGQDYGTGSSIRILD